MELRLTLNLSSHSEEKVLRSGTYTIGRNPSSDIVIDHETVSSRHARLTIGEEYTLIEDLQSANGVLVDGARITKKLLNLPARLHLGGVELTLAAHMLASSSALEHKPEVPLFAPDLSTAPTNPSPRASLLFDFLSSLKEKGLTCVKLANQYFEWKWAVAATLALFIVANAFLTLLPLVGRSHEYVENEAIRRALFIAKQLAAANERAVFHENFLLLSTKLAEEQEGVISAQIVDINGKILSPAHLAHRYISNAKEVIGLASEKPEIQKISADEHLITYPILAYSRETGRNMVRALAQIYFSTKDMGLTAEGAWKIVLTSIFSSLFLGAIALLVIYLLSTLPLKALENTLTQEMRGKTDLLKTPFRWKELESLMVKTNSLLSQMKEHFTATSFGQDREVNE